MSDTNWLACSVGWFKLCNVVLYLWSKAVVFTWHWELKHWHKSGLISASKSRTPNFYPVYWTWQSKLNPVQLFLNFLLSFIFMIQLKLYPYFPGLGWGGGTKCSIYCFCNTSFCHVQFHRCVKRGPTLYTWAVRSTLNYPSVMLNQSGDIWQFQRGYCRLLAISFFSYCSL